MVHDSIEVPELGTVCVVDYIESEHGSLSVGGSLPREGQAVIIVQQEEFTPVLLPIEFDTMDGFEQAADGPDEEYTCFICDEGGAWLGHNFSTMAMFHLDCAERFVEAGRELVDRNPHLF